MAPGLRSDGQFNTQGLGLIMAGVIHRGVHHVIDGVHQTGHVLLRQIKHTLSTVFPVSLKKTEEHLWALQGKATHTHTPLL